VEILEGHVFVGRRIFEGEKVEVRISSVDGKFRDDKKMKHLEKVKKPF
jgi:hypothetical protein